MMQVTHEGNAPLPPVCDHETRSSGLFSMLATRALYNIRATRPPTATPPCARTMHSLRIVRTNFSFHYIVISSSFCGALRQKGSTMS